MPSSRLEKRDWQKDHVYLVQYPRCGSIPSMSPWAFKLETWLRLNNIPYTNISNEFKKFSTKGQVPFIEYNGRHIPDSNFIIKELKKEFNKECEPKVRTDYALAQAFHSLVEDQLAWCLMYFRSRNMKIMTSDAGWGRHMNGAKKTLFNVLIPLKFRKKLVGKLQAHGIGRHSPAEVEDITKEIFNALSVQLASKDFFFGDTPTTFDCCAFAFLAQFIYAEVPGGPAFKKYLAEATPNLTEFVNRMKARVWPDWEQIGTSLDFNSKPQ